MVLKMSHLTVAKKFMDARTEEDGPNFGSPLGSGPWAGGWQLLTQDNDVVAEIMSEDLIVVNMDFDPLGQAVIQECEERGVSWERGSFLYGI